MVGCLSCRFKPWNLFQVHDGADDTGKDKSIVGFEDGVRADWRNHISAPVDLHQKQPRQASQAGRFNALADESAGGSHQHLDKIFSPRVSQLFHEILALRQQSAADGQHVESADHGTRNSRIADFKETHLSDAGLPHQPVDDEIRTRSDA